MPDSRHSGSVQSQVRMELGTGYRMKIDEMEEEVGSIQHVTKACSLSSLLESYCQPAVQVGDFKTEMCTVLEGRNAMVGCIDLDTCNWSHASLGIMMFRM